MISELNDNNNQNNSTVHPSSPLYGLTTQQQQQFRQNKLILEEYRNENNGGLALQPRWHALDGLPMTQFNRGYQFGRKIDGQQPGYRPFIPQ